MDVDQIITRLDHALPLLFAKIAHRIRVPGAGPAAMMALHKLKLSGTCTVSELADWMGVTSATVTGITNKLADQDLIERWREEEDRRVVRIRLTEKGARLLDELERKRKAKVLALVGRLSQDELQRLTEIVERLIEVISQE